MNKAHLGFMTISEKDKILERIDEEKFVEVMTNLEVEITKKTGRDVTRVELAKALYNYLIGEEPKNT